MKAKLPNQLPPRWLTRLFIWLCRPAEIDDLLGDMEEMYRANLSNKPVWRARYSYFTQCLALVFSYTVKKRKRSTSEFISHRSTQTHIAMYFNYLKMVLRRLRRRVTFSFINIFGLGTGLATCFIILLFIRTETSFDRFHQDADRIYRLTKSFPMGGQTVETLEMRSYFMPTLEGLIPAVDSHCQIEDVENGVLVTSHQEPLEEKQVAFVDKNFFEFFSFRLIVGDVKEVLNEPYTMAISESAARRHFGNTSPMGKTLKLFFPADERSLDVKINGLFEDMPVNSHLHKDFLLSLSTGVAENRKQSIQGFIMQHSYFKVEQGRSIAEVNEALPGIENEHAPGFFKKLGMHLGTQPLLDVHLKSNMQKEFEANSNEQYIQLLGALGIVILLIAAFNYMNLATAQSLDQAKEVGVRKVMGSHRSQLIVRFVTESVTISVLGLVLAAFIVSLALPFFNELSGRVLLFDINEQWIMIPGFAGIAVVLGLLAGIYPALYMSGFQVVKSLKGGLSKQGKGTQFFRKGLVVTQFVMSIVLMLATGIVFKQFGFMMNKELGLDTESVVHINTSANEVSRQFDKMKEELLRYPEIAAVSGSNAAPVNDFSLRQTNGLMLPGTSEEISMNYLRIDKDFFDLYDVPLVLGQSYTDFGGDALSGLIVNKIAMIELGFHEGNVLGQQVSVYDGYEPYIIGVVDDFHLESLHKEIGPVYFQLMGRGSGDFSTMSIKVTGASLSKSITAIQDVYEGLVETTPLQMTFMNDRIARAYESEKFFVRTFGIFTLLAVIMACMGALGLAMQMVVSKQKEVGVRKVLGASVRGITALLTRELMLLVLLANLIAWPLAYWGVSNWLQNFPYRESIGVGVFLLVLTVSVLITFMSVGAVSVRAALVNPIKSLRSE